MKIHRITAKIPIFTSVSLVIEYWGQISPSLIMYVFAKCGNCLRQGFCLWALSYSPNFHMKNKFNTYSVNHAIIYTLKAADHSKLNIQIENQQCRTYSNTEIYTDILWQINECHIFLFQVSEKRCESHQRGKLSDRQHGTHYKPSFTFLFKIYSNGLKLVLQDTHDTWKTFCGSKILTFSHSFLWYRTQDNKQYHKWLPLFGVLILHNVCCQKVL